MTDREIIEIHFSIPQHGSPSNPVLPFMQNIHRPAPFHKVHYRLPGSRRSSRPTRGSRLTFQLALLVNGVCLAILGLGIYNRLTAKSPENLLQVGQSSFKLKPTSAEKPAKPVAPAATELAHHQPGKVAHSPPPRAMAPVQPVKQEGPMVLALPPDVPLFAEPPRPLGPVDPVDPLALDWEPIQVFSNTFAPHRGDSPMLRNWKTMEWASILTVALTVTPAAFAGEKDAKLDAKAIIERLDTMDKAIGKSFKEVGDILEHLKGDHLTFKSNLEKMTTKVELLEDLVAKLQSDMDKLKKRIPAEQSLAPTVDKASLDELKSRLGSIEQALAKMQKPDRISLAPPSSGRIVLVNLYPEELLFRVNGRDFRVSPYTNMPLDQAAGQFSYEVFSPTHGLRASNTLTLVPNQTFTITAR